MTAANRGPADEGLLLINGQWQVPQEVPLENFTTFYNETWPVIRRFARAGTARMGGVADVDDITQDVFVIALQNWDRIGRLDNPTGYLARVALRLANKAAQNIYRELPERNVEDYLLGYEADASHLVLLDESIRNLLSQLSTRQAEILILGSYGFTDQEVGHILDLTPGTIRSHRRHARDHFWGLREELEHKEPTD